MLYQQLIPNNIPLNDLGNYQSNYQLMADAVPNNIVTPGELGISGYGALYDMVSPYITAAQDWWGGVPVNMPYPGQMQVAAPLMQQVVPADQQVWRDNWLGSQVQQILDRDAMY